MQEERQAAKLQVEITWKTIIKVLLGILLAFVAVKLWPFFKLLILSVLIAVALGRIVLWLCHRGWPRWAGLLVASATLITSVLAFFALLGPLVFNEAVNLAKEVPKLSEQAAAHLPQAGPVHNAIQSVTQLGTTPDTQRLVGKALNIATTTFGGVFDFMLVLVLAIYLVADGNRALRWLIAFFPIEQCGKISEALAEIGGQIAAYTVGQIITSALCGCYVFVLLSILHVPMALLLAVVAGVFDILPIVGFFLSVIPAMLVGLTVSPVTAMLVFVFYGAYHLLENYYIVPKIYGNKLRLSNLAVLLSLIVGGVLAGVIGALVILPFVAAYPAVERLWLPRRPEPDLFKEPEEQLRAA